MPSGPAGILADFVSLANWTFVHAVAPLTEPGNKEVFSIHRRGAKQNKALSSAVLLIQISDPHLRMKLVPDRLLVLGVQQRTDQGLCSAGR